MIIITYIRITIHIIIIIINGSIITLIIIIIIMTLISWKPLNIFFYNFFFLSTHKMILQNIDRNLSIFRFHSNLF